ncbi:ABC transporter permease [Thermodesulfobacteriota bacterium]
MIRYVAGRVMQGLIALFVATIVVFGLARLTGNPLDVLLPETATEEEYADMSNYFGLDKPLPVQYWVFITKAVRGDFGRSVRYRRPVMEFIVARAPATLKLAAAAALASFLISLPAGMIAAIKRDRWQDIIAKIFAILGQSLPTFWLGIVLIQVMAVELGWLPAAGYQGIRYWILPAITLGYHSTAGVLRLTRSAMLDVLSTDYVRLARIKGVPERLVMFRHALRNASIPVVTFSGMIYVHFLMGSVVTETIFAWPGLGRLAYEAVMHRDFPLIQGLILIFVALYIFVNLLVDVLYVYLDPRIRYVKE